ncbi:MAG TPA: tRNA (adenosine(37)-N6)-threonylcarbamoyltransferase complex dimerization subunit type 1 TsaB [Candidatus Hydrogenedentes bacterium]|nr:tRNA (adenosine(37)-N6)-threonylcarbamoyltransferase complex dimerization subunit type 1 TsaB [Candidatus Hydrogenedentota bacterium]HPG65528.1 tRNA (adenosine(37)-N6)-threonylcarbamoyltransferase complex dimerization subunit type 1 TsaB [Candidatus Hydrogenedentota bacterium]
MKILAADTSTSINTVAVCDGDAVWVETVAQCGRRHSERLIETVHWVLREAGLELRDLDALAISNGPGSFTGLRVGVATWKGLALGAGLPLVAVPTLDALARCAGIYSGDACPVIDAKMGEVFGAFYEFTDGQRMKRTEDRVCPVESLLCEARQHTFVFGDGAERYRERIEACAPSVRFLPKAAGLPRASCVAAEACALLEVGASADPALVAPVYLRKSQAEENRERPSTAEASEP